jgi:hypothetical protein
MLFKRDPGPCPVDDFPHTTCTSPDYDGSRIVAGRIIPTTHIEVQPPGSGRAPAPKPSLERERVQATVPPGAFTTTSYQREKHGKKRRFGG